jgi:peptidyl-prolyl cis-trans isomerase C
MNRVRFVLPLLASLSMSLPLAAIAADPAAPPIATVNGVVIPAIYGDFVRQMRESRNVPADALSPEAVRDSLIASELLVQEALKLGLDKEPSVASALEFQKRELIGKAAIEHFARKNPISEDVLKAEYDKTKAKVGGQEYRVSHILVNTEKEANALIAELKKPKAKFDALAKKSSKDTSAGNGGDLGWILPANLVPEFAQAMTAMKKGQTSIKPVQTQFGWHVIRLVDTRAVDFPTYDKLKGRIANQLQQLAIRRHVQELRATAKVE